MGSPAQYRNPEDRAKLIDTLKREGSVTNYEVELVTKTGEPRIALISAALQGETISGMILDITVSRRATEALRQFEKSVSFADERRAVIILDVNVWMGGTANAKAHYMNIVKMTKNAIRNSGLPIDRTLLMIKTLYDCHDETQWHCARNNQLIREVSSESGMPLFDFDKLWKEHGLDPTRALRRDKIGRAHV